jgi:hypothetical protein
MDAPAGGPGTGSTGPEPEETVDESVDEAAEETFPASDPPSSWAGPDDPPE